jgi:ArsR family transcriptional regulator
MGKNELSCDCDVIHEDVVAAVAKKMPPEENFFELSDFFKVFGDSTRIRILWALDESEMCVCDIAVLLNMTKSAVSHQLRQLRGADLVKTRRDGKVIFYSLADDHVKKILEMAVEHLEEREQ